MTLAPDFTIDAFHRGAFFIKQPATRGYRAGMDAMMLAACVPSSFAGKIVDIGAGAGAVSFAVLSRCKKARALLVENSSKMIAYAHQSVNLAQNSHLKDRVKILSLDITVRGKIREMAGLTNNQADYIVMNPPFNSARDRQTPDILKKQAHIMDDALFEDWLRCAAAIAKSNGGLSLIARPLSLRKVLEAIDSRFGGVEIKAIHPRLNTPAIRFVLRAEKGSRKPLSMHPPVFLHNERGGEFTKNANAIINGEASLFGD